MCRSTQFTALIATAVATALAVTGCSTIANEETSAEKPIAYLWAIGAMDASLVSSDDDTYLELAGIEEIITRFSDRPNREASEVDLRDFLGRWEGRFADDPPNAVLSYQAEEGAAPVQVVVEISRPRYDEAAARIVFAAELIEFTPDTLDGADHPVDAPPPVVPAHTGPVSLFIDSDGPAVSLGEVAAIDAATASASAAILEFQTAIQQSQTARMNQLDEDLRTHISAISASNNRIGELNNAMAAVSTALDTKEPSSKPTDLLKDTVAATAKAALESNGVTAPKIADVASYEALATELKSDIDGMSNTQQMDMLRLQSLSNKYNETYDTMSDFMKKIADSRTAILRPQSPVVGSPGK
jgi:hypothetical protein